MHYFQLIGPKTATAGNVSGPSRTQVPEQESSVSFM